MPTSKTKIAEQVQRIYSRYVDRENIDPIIYREEIVVLVEQSINEVLQAQTFNARRVNRVDIPQSSLVKYTLATSNSQATLPAFPIDLEKDMGVWEVVDPSAPLVPFIPLGDQVAKVMQGTITQSLQGATGYYRYGDKIHFLKTPPANVDIYLLVSDLSTLGDLDPLPLSAAYERTVIMKCLEALGLGQYAQNELNSRNNREDIIKEAKEERMNNAN